MPLRAWLAAALLVALAACVRPSRPRIPDPPEVLAVVWKRVGLERPPLDSAPQAIRAWRPSEWLRVSYRSYASVVLVDVWRMPSESVAFEARQKWRNEPGAVASQWRDLLLVCSSSVESTQGLAEFSARLEAEWLAKAR
ncbi:MAG: hypothetical protein WHT08_02035 [Bryobacteraceae bacterium]